MIKLLLVDDEYYTREGLLQDINWAALGIDRVDQAENGHSALKIAMESMPDIVLTDVRMAKMDGIELSYKVREINPNCIIIFMSGYFEKDYLKSAIDLSAINYVEKPLNLNEIRTVISKAVTIFRDNLKKKNMALELENKLQTSIPFVKNDTALLLLKANPNTESMIKYLDLAIPEFVKSSCYFTILINLRYLDEYLATTYDIKCDEIEAILNQSNMIGIVGTKDQTHIVVHVCKNFKESQSIPRTKIEYFYDLLENYFDETAAVSIAIGKNVNNIYEIFKSYGTAVVGLQRLFFHKNIKLIFNDGKTGTAYIFDDAIIADFYKCLVDKNKDGALFLLKKLTSDIRMHENTLIRYIKDLYHRILLQLVRIFEEMNIDFIASDINSNYLWEAIFQCESLDELEELAVSKVNYYFKKLSEKYNENDIAISILKYIHDNYNDSSLSLKKVSEFSYLSPSYICVLFKNTFKKTLNNYITDYRIEKSKEYLRNKCLSLDEIAERVGFSNGNYYSKAFKKVTGMNPTDFREKSKVC